MLKKAIIIINKIAINAVQNTSIFNPAPFLFFVTYSIKLQYNIKGSSRVVPWHLF